MADPGLYHEYESEVADSQVEGIIKPQAHWNAKHKPVKLLGYELVKEEKITTGQSSVTFTGLAGNTDKEYLLEFKLKQSVTGTNAVLYVQLNSISTGYYGEVTRWWGGNGDVVNYTTVFGIVRHGSNGQALYQNGKVEIDAEVDGDFPRFYDGSCVSKSPTETVKGICGGTLDESVTEVTSIKLGTDQGTFIGTVRLWKKLPLNLED